MEIQFHPESGRGSVRTYSLSLRAERVAAAVAGALLLLLLSLCWTGPVVALRWSRHQNRTGILQASRSLSEGDRALAGEAAALAGRALALGDRLTRIAFLYEIPPASWPRVLDPERGVLADHRPEKILPGLERYLMGLERARVLLAERETADRELPGRVPSILPLSARLFEPSAFFGPRVSPWTGEEEFFPGLDLAAPEGSAVISPGAATVLFAGRVRPSRTGWLWRLGNVVALSHGQAAVTLFGHLSRMDVRTGQRLARGDRVGGVGKTGWAMAPQLHYELWRFEDGRWRPTDPLYAVLDHRLEAGSVSLLRMRATSFPGSVEALPGEGRRRSRVVSAPYR